MCSSASNKMHLTVFEMRMIVQPTEPSCLLCGHRGLRLTVPWLWS